MFPHVDVKKTSVEKKTVDPLFDCSFVLDVDYKTVCKEGTFLHFAVFDADVIGRDELEGEAVLPLSSLDGVGEKSRYEMPFMVVFVAGSRYHIP